MISARNRGFEIAQHGIHPTECRVLDTLTATTQHMGFVLVHIAIQSCETLQAIRKDAGSRRQRLARPRVNRLFGKRQALQRQEHRPTISARLNGSNEGRLVFRTAPTFACLFAAQVGVVNFYATFQNPLLLPLGHDLQQFVLDQPGRFVANAQVAFQLECRDIVLGLGQQVHGEEPAGERQFGRLKDGAGSDRALVTATMALPVGSALSNKAAVARVGATRAAKTRRPARRFKRRQTLFLGAVLLEKLSHRQSVLKLNMIHLCHGASPCGRYAQLTPRQAHHVSLAEVCR